MAIAKFTEACSKCGELFQCCDANKLTAIIELHAMHCKPAKQTALVEEIVSELSTIFDLDGRGFLNGTIERAEAKVNELLEKYSNGKL